MREHEKFFSMRFSPEDRKKIEEFDKLKEEYTERFYLHIKDIAKELGVSDGCAADIIYFRGQLRHTPELEERLIALWQAGTPPDIHLFGTYLEKPHG